MNKICHLTSVHTPFDTRIFRKECVSLTNADYKVTLIVSNTQDDVVENINIRSLTKPKTRSERITKTIWKVLEYAIDENADIYHFHDPELIPIGLILKGRGKKVIYDVHEDVPRQILSSKNYIPNFFRRLVSGTVEKIENFAVKYFDAVVTATPYIRDRFLKIGCNAIDINNYPILDELYIAKTTWEQKEKAVCYVGGIWDKRGLFEMVEAIGKTNVSLILAGKFAYSEQRDKALTMPGWNNIQELGYLNREGVAQTLANSMAGLVVLHPIINYLYALPVKMFEYMCAGIPVIASNIPLWKEIIEGNQCGICVDPMNYEAIAKAIQWIVDNPDEAKRMGENGRKAVEEKYNWENEAKKLRALYKELLS
ncbi:group 1 glycosyl transferase [Calothrix parasitica NIES-267]|uniref:Group 1 glycosyl transferase n=1 Tax=Calothrix parasitica NIES-267 TaxID=1973488 RepID=A0A1Z4LRR2_9CYAN|nr:group 1 glycosyl transferase [Calothrix parasitica NIES-267]